MSYAIRFLTARPNPHHIDALFLGMGCVSFGLLLGLRFSGWVMT